MSSGRVGSLYEWARTAPLDAFAPDRFTRGAAIERRDYGEDPREVLVH